MATGADIPPELLRRILFDVCEDASGLLNPYCVQTVQNRKEAIKNITACSLTCVYWARICREELFEIVAIKDYEDMRAFLSLVVNTPTRFAPISEYVSSATLLQRVGDRPWLHLLRMQPSLFQLWPLLHSDVLIYFLIENSQNDVTSLRSSTSRRLFASLPRTPPSSCLRCNGLIINNPYFMTPHDLVSFLRKFSRCRYLLLTNVAWSAQADFASDLLARDLLLIPPFSRFDVEVYCSAYAAETAWVAFSTVLRVRDLSSQASTATLASEYDGYDKNKHCPTLQVLSSAQQAIFDICKAVCKVSSLNCARFDTRPTMSASNLKAIPLKDTRAYYICNTTINGFEPAADEVLSKIELVFYGTQAVIPVTNVSDSIVVDSISVLCAYITSTEEFSTAGRSSNALPTHPPDPWAEIAGLCAAQPGFIRLQLQFKSHDHLVQFMEAQRGALGQLDRRIALFYRNEEKSIRRVAADFETLADLGNAYEHGFINPIW